MPTILIVDNSLSMLRFINKTSGETYLSWVSHLLDKFFLAVSATNFLEYISYMIDPALPERKLSNFTRNFTDLTTFVNNINGRPIDFTLTIDFAQKEFLKIWGPNVPANYVIITDGHDEDEYPRKEEKVFRDEAIANLKEHLHGTLTVLSLSEKVPEDLKWLAKLTQGSILTCGPATPNQMSTYSNNNCLTFLNVDNVAKRLASVSVAANTLKLNCGHLDSYVQLYPPLRLKKSLSKEKENTEEDMDDDVIMNGDSDEDLVLRINLASGTSDDNKLDLLNLDIFGFLRIADVHSPPTDTRHLVLPIRYDEETGHSSAALRDEDLHSPNFAVLLHGALKVNKMVAIATLHSPGDGGRSRFNDVNCKSHQNTVASGSCSNQPLTTDSTNSPVRYALLYSLSDQRKANLVVAFFHEGVSSLSWLGQFSHLAPISDYDGALYDDGEGKTPFPVRVPNRLSYWTSANDGGGSQVTISDPNALVPSYPHTSWLNPTVVTNDIQKVVRTSRRLIDRGPAFYKELNRVRSAALAYGFTDVLASLGKLLEREIAGQTNQKAVLELRHVISRLETPAHNGPIKPPTVENLKVKSEKVIV